MNSFKEYNKILIINLGGIGDILLSTPALRALKYFFPRANISILVVPRVRELVNDLAYIDNVFVFHKDLRYFLKDFFTLFILRRQNFDLAINMRTLVSQKSAKKMKFLLDIIRPKVKAGRNTESRGYFFDVAIPGTDIGQKYEMEYDIDTVKALGIDFMDKDIELKIEEESIRKVDKILEKENLSSDTILIGIHPGGEPSRRWPVERFSKVIDEINKRIHCKFVITASQDETDLINRLIRITSTKMIDLSGRLNIKELCALIKRCDLYISNDTGPMHLAAILKTPLVAIFGPGDIVRFDPRNISPKSIVLYKKVNCAPCNRKKCNDLKCLSLISPEEVLKSVFEVLAESVKITK